MFISARFKLNRFIYNHAANQGFSIGINDVTPGDNLRKIKENMVEKAYKDCDKFIADYQKGQLETMSGCNEEETLEVGKAQRTFVRDLAGRISIMMVFHSQPPDLV